MITETNKSTAKQVTPSLYFGQVLQSLNIMTLVHLNSTNDAEHVYTGEYVKKLYELSDDLIEIYQGGLEHSGRVNIVIPSSSYCNPSQHLTSLSYYMQAHRNIFKDDVAVQTTIDDILKLIQKTKFTLTL